LDGSSDALSSANLEGDLGEAGADSAWKRGTRCFRAGAGAEGGGVTGAGSAGCCSGLVRQRRVGVDGLLLLPPVAALLTAEKKPPPLVLRGLGASCCGRRFLFLASRSRSSSRWTDVHSALRHPVPMILLGLGWSGQRPKKKRSRGGMEEGRKEGGELQLVALISLARSLIATH